MSPRDRLLGIVIAAISLLSGTGLSESCTVPSEIATFKSKAVWDKYVKEFALDVVGGENTFNHFLFHWAGKPDEDDKVYMVMLYKTGPGQADPKVLESINGSQYQILSALENQALIKIHTHPGNLRHVIALGKNRVFLTLDGGRHWSNNTWPTTSKHSADYRTPRDTLTFNPHANSDWTAITFTDGSLGVSSDMGRNWEVVTKLKHYDIQLIEWNEDTPTSLFALGKTTKSPSEFHLLRVDANTRSFERVVDTTVTAFGYTSHILYIVVEEMVEDRPGRKTAQKVLKVAPSGSNDFITAKFPTDEKLFQYYSILDSSGNVIFVHVAHKLDEVSAKSSAGDLFVSDASGVYFTVSLRDLMREDFYVVTSIPGVYLGTVQKNDKLLSRISLDRGASWHPIKVAGGKTLQIVQKKAQFLFGLPDNTLPHTSRNAVGIIMVHGFEVEEGLPSSSWDDHKKLTYKDLGDLAVYVSSDGGYTWKKTTLMGAPHAYVIGNSGGFLAAMRVREHTTQPELHVSSDEGACWHSLTLNTTMTVIGLITETGGKSMIITAVGYVDKTWHVVTVDLLGLIPHLCDDKANYNWWSAHSTLNDIESCFLGSKTKYKRLDPNAWCRNVYDYDPNAAERKTEEQCPCTKEDFECSFGYVRLTDDTGINTSCILDRKYNEPTYFVCEKNEAAVSAWTVKKSSFRMIAFNTCNRTQAVKSIQTLDDPMLEIGNADNVWQCKRALALRNDRPLPTTTTPIPMTTITTTPAPVTTTPSSKTPTCPQQQAPSSTGSGNKGGLIAAVVLLSLTLAGCVGLLLYTFIQYRTLKKNSTYDKIAYVHASDKTPLYSRAAEEL